MTNGNDPLNQFTYDVVDEMGYASSAFHPGLTKREYFAAMAMQGLMAVNNKGETTFEAAAPIAVSVADALIKALNNQPC